jgi:hypothetical protein
MIRLTVAHWARGEAARESVQFLGAMETLNVLPRRLPQPVQQSFRSRSSTLMYGGRVVPMSPYHWIVVIGGDSSHFRL